MTPVSWEHCKNGRKENTRLLLVARHHKIEGRDNVELVKDMNAKSLLCASLPE